MKSARLAMLAAGAVALAVLGGASGAGAAGSSAPAAPALGGPACPAGSTEVSISSSSVLPGGGYRYNYDVAGVQQALFVAPANFKPYTASDAQLAEYAFPPKPASGSPDRDKWNAAMSGYQASSTDRLCKTVKLISQPLGGGEATSAATNIWSGYVGQGSGITDVSAHYNEPMEQSCACSTPANTDEVTWVGIGGYGSGSIIQDGTEIGQELGSHAWYEYVCPGGKSSCSVSIQRSGAVTTGADVYAYVYYHNGTSGFYVSQNGTALLQAQKSPSGVYDGSTGEFIAERATYNGTAAGCGTYCPLAHFGQINWTSATINGAGIASMNPIGLEMVNGGSFVGSPACGPSNLMSYPFGISGSSFHTVWCRAS